MYNAFGLVNGSDVRIAGVNAGTSPTSTINAEKRAVVTVESPGRSACSARTRAAASEPQSLIAEYFITCSPKGPPLPDGGDDPRQPRRRETVQNDLVQNTLREPFRERLRC